MTKPATDLEMEPPIVAGPASSAARGGRGEKSRNRKRIEPPDLPLDADVPCRSCGRNLRGLMRSGRCPGCTSSVVSSIPPSLRELPGKLAGLTLGRQVYVLAVWPFMEQMLNFLVGFVDTMLAGYLSVSATEALAVSAYLGWLVSLLQVAMGVGASAVIARAIGGRHRRIANAALGQAIVLVVIVGVLFGAAVIAVSPWIVHLMGARGQAHADAVVYLRIVCAVAPFSGVLFVGAAALRAAGDTRTPFFVLVIVNIINAVGNVLFVFGPAPIGGHGVAGIAAGTAVAWCVGAMLILTVLILGRGGIRLRLIRLRPHVHTMRQIARIATPNLLESIGVWTCNFIMVTIVGQVGRLWQPGALGAHLIAIRLEAISYLPGFALGIAASTLVGQYLGVGDVDRARRASLLCFRAAAVIMCSMGVFFLAAPSAMVRLVTNEEVLIHLASPLMRIAGLIQLFFAMTIVFSETLRGAGDTRTSMWTTYLSMYVFRLSAAFILGYVMGMGVMGVWIAICGEIAVRGMLMYWRFRQGKWARLTLEPATSAANRVAVTSNPSD